MHMAVKFYRQTSGKEPVRLWLRSLEPDDRKVIGKDIAKIQIHWPVGMPIVRSLGRGLWEIRSSLDHRIARIIFVIEDGHMVLLHGFIKKTKTRITAK